MGKFILEIIWLCGSAGKIVTTDLISRSDRTIFERPLVVCIQRIFLFRRNCQIYKVIQNLDVLFIVSADLVRTPSFADIFYFLSLPAFFCCSWFISVDSVNNSLLVSTFLYILYLVFLIFLFFYFSPYNEFNLLFPSFLRWKGKVIDLKSFSFTISI